jgi:hypothetical protein
MPSAAEIVSLKIDILPFERQDLPETRAAEGQQTDGGHDVVVLGVD